jgi:GT2 family glycosyltransferase/glycosyltransferase involved in cell wall biosynthesis
MERSPLKALHRHVTQAVKVAFASGSEAILPAFLERFDAIRPDLALYVVSEYRPARGEWIRYRTGRSRGDNEAYLRWVLREKQVQLAAVVLQPQMPFWKMRLIALRLAPLRTLFYNENLDHFMLRPGSLGNILGHLVWRAKNFVRWQRRRKRPAMLTRIAIATGWIAIGLKRLLPVRKIRLEGEELPKGISVVIPTRNGRELLERLMPVLHTELASFTSEIIVVDNGSNDGSADILNGVIVERSVEPLSFARAVNRGIRRARYSHILLLNNDMVLHPGFFAPLLHAFKTVPDLFCATAQIFLPEGQRREETGKAVFHEGADFPVMCEPPTEGEDGTFVLYGSGGCSFYDARKLRAMGEVGEMYEPAYVEDLDLGFRAWQLGWPTVFAAGAQVTHQHRATTSRYYSEAELLRMVEVNFFRFLARCVRSQKLFTSLWKSAVERSSAFPLSSAMEVARPLAGRMDDASIFALCYGSAANFPGVEKTGRPVVMVVSPYIPFPLSHGGAVRMYNLMRRAAHEYDLVLLTFVDELHTPPPEILQICAEVVEVRRTGTHTGFMSDRPDVVEEFDSQTMHEAVRQSARKWKPAVAQLEFTQMAQYGRDCVGAKTVLVEHDITLDLHEQLYARDGDWETRYQLERWHRFETRAWREVDAVVTMSDKDRQRVEGARECVAIANGVDLVRFQPSDQQPDPARLLFIGSFAHLPNVLALEFFLHEVWPLLQEYSPTLHIIAGTRHGEYAAGLKLDQPGIEVEGFVADVRAAYRRATVVIAPLLASAGTNIKIMEAMAMGKAIVSTSGGVNGLSITPGTDVEVTDSGEAMARSIDGLLTDPIRRRAMEKQARRSAEERYDWDAIARVQSELYRRLTRFQSRDSMERSCNQG